MEKEEGRSDNRPDVEPQNLEFVKPEFAEMFQRIRDDMDVVFPKVSEDAKMTAAVGVLLSTRIDTAVTILKTPTKMMKVGPGGVIVPGG